MSKQRLKLHWVLGAICAAALLAGGCPLTFEGMLPADLDASISHIIENPENFGQETGSSDTGVVMDDLAGLSGCWGAVVEAVAGTGSLGQMDSYSLLRFQSGGVLTTWDVVDTGGFGATVYDGSGRYEVIGDSRLQFTIESRRYYSPLTQTYDEYVQTEVSEWLATLDGDRLYVRMLDEPGAPAPGPDEADYTILYRRFDCLP